MESAPKETTSIENTITDKGKGMMSEEQIQGEKSEQKTSPIVDEGIRLPCAPNL